MCKADWHEQNKVFTDNQVLTTYVLKSQMSIVVTLEMESVPGGLLVVLRSRAAGTLILFQR